MYDRSPFAPPASINVHERGILGLDYRKIALLGVSLPAAAAVVLLWRSGPLAMRGALGALVALMGVAIAFGQIEGRTPEAWLANFLWYLRRQKFMQHRALRVTADNRQVRLAGEEEARPAAARATRGPDFFVLTANAIGLSALTAMAIWLAQGGGGELLRTLPSLLARSS